MCVCVCVCIAACNVSGGSKGSSSRVYRNTKYFTNKCVSNGVTKYMIVLWLYCTKLISICRLFESYEGGLCGQ